MVHRVRQSIQGECGSRSMSSRWNQSFHDAVADKYVEYVSEYMDNMYPNCSEEFFLWKVHGADSVGACYSPSEDPEKTWWKSMMSKGRVKCLLDLPLDKLRVLVERSRNMNLLQNQQT